MKLWQTTLNQSGIKRVSVHSAPTKIVIHVVDLFVQDRNLEFKTIDIEGGLIYEG
jgi:hypothetical protein